MLGLWFLLVSVHSLNSFIVCLFGDEMQKMFPASSQDLTFSREA